MSMISEGTEISIRALLAEGDYQAFMYLSFR